MKILPDASIAHSTSWGDRKYRSITEPASISRSI
jgi:hypothetical protein